ncbi:MAG: ORF6N domain-containing protein, partial [Fibrobacteraceae bacterium]|nr:ORF6N domain-containing protein [Fibrobacteraceae bacterium]
MDRFPERCRFQLTEDEKRELVTICDRFEILKHLSSLPDAFTEQGVAMLSAVLHSDNLEVLYSISFTHRANFLYSETLASLP